MELKMLSLDGKEAEFKPANPPNAQGKRKATWLPNGRGVLISDEYTNPHKRQAMHEKRMRKMEAILPLLDAPKLWGADEAQVTLVGWGSTEGVVQEAIQQLAAQGVPANLLQIKWLVPLHGEAIVATLAKSKKTIIVENNYSGQFARYLRRLLPAHREELPREVQQAIDMESYRL